MSNWHSVWTSRQDRERGSTLARALELDGFDDGAGQVAEDEWIGFVKGIAVEGEYSRSDSILELGCGAGALLLGLEEVNAGMTQIGLDYSQGLLDYAQVFLPSASFICADLREPLPDLQTVDHVLVHSVLQYLSVDEADRLVRQAFGLASSTVAFLDVPDREMEVKSEEMRRLARPEGEYESSYRHLVHTYYDRSFFESLVPGGWRIDWIDTKLGNYANAPFRFSFFYRRGA